jgi:hypothetical protein
VAREVWDRTVVSVRQRFQPSGLAQDVQRAHRISGGQNVILVSAKDFAAQQRSGCDDLSVGEPEVEAAQAVELIRALCDQLQKMTAKLAWVERPSLTPWNSQAAAMRLEAAALRRDIPEAQSHIDRLQRRYLSGGERIQQRSAGRTTSGHGDSASQVIAKRPPAAE